MKRFVFFLLAFAFATQINAQVDTLSNKESSTLHSQTASIRQHLGVRGSFMIAAVGKDGIIVATDTRGCIFDKEDPNKTPVAYFDGTQKQFIIGHSVLANTGNATLGNLFFTAFIANFTQNTKKCPEVDNFFITFFKYCQNLLNEELLSQLLSNSMLVAGYQNNKPTICYYDNDSIGCIENFGFIESDLSSFSKNYNQKLNCDSIAILAERAIQEYAMTKEHWKTIGGEISIIKIPKNLPPVWVKKSKFNDWIYTYELIDDYKKGHFKLNFIKPFNKKDLDKIIYGE